MTRPARPPVVVLFGGPSAEHDVSVVSGTAIADALAAPAVAVAPGPHRPRRRLVVAARRTIAAATGPPAAYDDPAALGATGRSPSVRRSTGWPPRDPRPSSSSPSTGRSARTARSRRSSRRPGSPTPGSGVAASALGMDKRCSSGCAAASACRSSTGARSGAARWADDPAAVHGRARRLRGRRPATRGSWSSPPGSGQLRRDDPRPRPGRAAGGARRWRSATTPSPWSRPTSPARATSRSRSSATTRRSSSSARARSSRGHEFYDYAAKYTPGLSETSHPRRGRPTAQRATLLKLARDAYRAIGAEGFARVDFLRRRRADRRSPRSTRSRASPRSASSRRCRPRAATTFADVCVRIVELALERHARRGRPAASAGGPAAMSAPSGATRAPDAARRPGRRTPRVRRARRPACPPSGPARRSSMLVAAAALYGVVDSSALRLRARSSSTAAHRPTDPRAVEAALAGAAARTCSGSRPLRSRRRSRRCPTVARRSRRRAARTRSPSRIDGARPDPHLAGRGPALPRRRRRHALRRAAGDMPPAAVAGLPVVDDGRAASAGLIVGQHASTRSTSTPRRGWLARPGRRRQLSAPGCGQRRPTQNGFVLARRPRLDRRLRLLHARACARPTSSRARSASCAACSSAARPRSSGSSSPRTTDARDRRRRHVQAHRRAVDAAPTTVAAVAEPVRREPARVAAPAAVG